MTVKVDIPPQVIERLYRYINEGCTLSVVEEEFANEHIQRWIANDNMILWSAPLEQEGEDG